MLCIPRWCLPHPSPKHTPCLGLSHQTSGCAQGAPWAGGRDADGNTDVSSAVGAEMGRCRLRCREASSSGAAAGLRATRLLSGPAPWEISKSFAEGLASLRPVRDKETQQRRDLPKVLLRREQKPGHPWPGPAEPPQLSVCCRLIPLGSTAWQCPHCLGSQLLHGPKCSPSGTRTAKRLWKHP